MPTDEDVADGVHALSALFAFDEIAWLRETAIAIARREGVRSQPRDLPDVHRTEIGFRKLAAHPRLLAHVRRIAGGPVILRATRLSVGAGFEIAANASETVRAVIFLDAGPGARLGSALLVNGTASYRDPRQAPGTLAFVASFASADARPEWIGRALRAERDDCLWQTPFLAAG
jgi:hypothetical protein